MYIYVYIERERERERESNSCCSFLTTCQELAVQAIHVRILAVHAYSHCNVSEMRRVTIRPP